MRRFVEAQLCRLNFMDCMHAFPAHSAHNAQVVMLLLGLVRGRGEQLTAAAGDAVYRQLEAARGQAQAFLAQTNTLSVEVGTLVVHLCSYQDIKPVCIAHENRHVVQSSTSHSTSVVVVTKNVCRVM